MEGYGTHQPFLFAAIAATSGRVLEIGAGDYSTMQLHALCRASRRRLLTIESSDDWMGKFIHLATDWHLFSRETDPGVLTSSRWAVCFLDQSPNYERGKTLQLLRNNVDIFVSHDTEPYVGDGYGFALLDSFTYRVDDERMPRTSLVSDTIDVAAIVGRELLR